MRKKPKSTWLKQSKPSTDLFLPSVTVKLHGSVISSRDQNSVQIILKTSIQDWKLILFSSKDNNGRRK